AFQNSEYSDSDLRKPYLIAGYRQSGCERHAGDRSRDGVAAGRLRGGVAHGPRRRLTRVCSVQDKLVWIDCEMTGLDLGSDKLIEIAALVTDGELNVLGDGVDVVIHADDAALEAMPPVVRRMHAKSGLTEEVRASTVSLAE